MNYKPLSVLLRSKMNNKIEVYNHVGKIKRLSGKSIQKYVLHPEDMKMSFLFEICDIVGISHQELFVALVEGSNSDFK